MLKRKNPFLATAAAFVSSLVVMTSILGAPAFAEDYPNKTIRLLVPYAAGGGTDAIARVVAQGLTDKFGQQMIVENNGTAGGNLAT